MEPNSTFPTSPLSSSTIDLISNETIKYNTGILINSTEFTEVCHYSRNIITHKPYKMLDIRLTIPYTSNDTENSRSRILLYLDDELLCDGTIYNPIAFVLRPIHLIGQVFNTKPGEHKLILKCCVNKGTLNIPHIYINGIEYTKEPKISGKLVVIGYN